MWDEHTEAMLRFASLLTAEDLDCLRAAAPAVADKEEASPPDEERPSTPAVEAHLDTGGQHDSDAASLSGVSASGGPSRGKRERLRTRKSKVSTACLGQERHKHQWRPVGTGLVGRIGSETFTATVVENPQVKSGRSVKITSGPAAGRICITPTRAAIEATEAYRQAHNLGRAGGITNGWTFWTPKG